MTRGAGARASSQIARVLFPHSECPVTRTREASEDAELDGLDAAVVEGDEGGVAVDAVGADVGAGDDENGGGSVASELRDDGEHDVEESIEAAGGAVELIERLTEHR